MMKPLLILGCAAFLSACTWVKLTDEGQNVAVLTAEQVRNCTARGDITVAVVDRVGLQRSAEKVEEELQTLARNSAADRGGDVIVPASQVTDGRRNYNVFQCRR